MAAAVVDRHISLSSYTDDSVQRPAIQALMQKVTKSEDTGAATPRWNRIDIQLNNGQTLSRTVTLLRGSHQDPLDDSELFTKWVDCLAFGGLMDQQDFYGTVMHGVDLIVPDLMQRLPVPQPQT